MLSRLSPASIRRLSTSTRCLSDKNEPDLSDPKTLALHKLYRPERTTPQKRGIDLLKSPGLNKGMAFSLHERQYLGVHGLLPPAFMTEEQQAYRIITKLRQQPDNLAKYIQLDSLQDRNEKLYYRVLCDNVKELMPIVYTPTVGQACQHFGFIYRNPKGLYITINDNSISKIHQILANWPTENVRAIVITDGERILGLGDLGTYGIGSMAVDVARLGARLICLVSALTVGFTLITFIHISSKIQKTENEIIGNQSAFKAKSQVIWAELMETGRSLRIPRSSYGTDEKKGVLHQCSQCTRLHCPQGPIGEEGSPGNDGQPGTPGKPGSPGLEGVDVDLEPQEELPCSICPAGPQGPRGAQGERGLPGNAGRKGKSGKSGHPGQPGGIGASGAKGPTGTRGTPGMKGPPGDTIIAGEGIKGPPGLQGSQGPKGPPGNSGRSSNIRGPSGKPGQQGGIGGTGKFGKYGEQGGIGAPGEPGLPATYCPSDCGVNTILSQFGSRAQHPESINGEDNGAPAANTEEYNSEERIESPAPPAPQPTTNQQQETVAAAASEQESFEESSYRSFFGH